MKFTPDSKLPDVVLIQPTLFPDDRGYFFESYRETLFNDNGIDVAFVQHNQSSSSKGVLRGLHFQTSPFGQAKCVRVLAGSVFDVAVDIRPGSETFGRWTGYTLSDKNHAMLFIPEGFAHGFLTLSATAVLTYQCSNYYSKDHEGCLIYNDDTVGIDWPGMDSPLLSEKDLQGLSLGAFR